MLAENDLNVLYKNIKCSINARLTEFKNIYECGSAKDIFKEMSFCTCTPQNNAQKAWNSVCALAKDGVLFNDDSDTGKIAEMLRSGGVRFHKNKAIYIVRNRENFYPDTKKIITKTINDHGSIIEVRNYLAKIVLGWGLKEASHFLRNIGFGSKLCILDRHILRQLVLYNVIKEVPKAITKSIYLETEQKMIAFASEQKIPLDAMDLLFWYKAKNELFK
ncbi:MAG: N-glycosylase/DNA lyase [Termitinemataceae bacterium]|nr:MAG: N-glycosylase/DNA lyase [Termitinemataceae bacterium]